MRIALVLWSLVFFGLADRANATVYDLPENGSVYLVGPDAGGMPILSIYFDHFDFSLPPGTLSWGASAWTEFTLYDTDGITILAQRKITRISAVTPGCTACDHGNAPESYLLVPEGIHLLTIESTSTGYNQTTGTPIEIDFGVSGRNYEGGQYSSYVTLLPAVPEASTWAMLLLGFASISFTAYRRRRLVQAL